MISLYFDIKSRQTSEVNPADAHHAIAWILLEKGIASLDKILQPQKIIGFSNDLQCRVFYFDKTKRLVRQYPKNYLFVHFMVIFLHFIS